ncbi:MAG: hypothetical protein K6G61_02875 [Solobacterium sp.]|nr:hypothetical protein [Solobacterium sp.]
MRLTQDAKTYIAGVLFGIYYASALPDVTMLVVEQPGLMGICNQVRTYSVYGIYLLAAYTLITGFLDSRGDGILTWVKRHLPFLAALAVCACVKVSTGDMLPLKIVLFMAAVHKTDLKKIFMILLGVHIVFTLLVFAAFRAGMITDVIVPRKNGAIRHSLGFIYPLDLHGHYLSMVFMYMYIRAEKFGIRDALLVNALSALLFIATNARTDLAVILLASLVLAAVNRIGLKKIGTCAAGICAAAYTLALSVTPFILTAVYDPENAFMARLNRMLTGRLAIQHRVIRETGYPLFGRVMEWIGWGAYDGTDRPDYNFIDCTFLKDTVDFGILFEILFIIGMIALFVYLLKKEDLPSVVIMAFFLLSCTIEYHTVLTYMYPILLLLNNVLIYEGKEIT